MDSKPYIADGESDEMLTAIRAALVGINPDQPVLFAPGDADVPSAWNRWLEIRFLPLIAPHLIAVREYVPEFRPKEIAAMDTTFSSELEAGEESRSARAARDLRASLEGAKHRPEIDKILAHLDKAESTGHFPTLFAARCASHHVSLASTLAAYLFFELKSGAPRWATSDILAHILPPVRTALDSRPDHTYRVA